MTVAHVAIYFCFRRQSRHTVNDNDVDGAGTDQRFADMELALSEPEIAGLYAAALDEAWQIMAEVLERSGLNHEDAGALSSPELTLFEGKLLLYRISGEAAHLRAMEREMIQCYEQGRAGNAH